MNAFTRSPKRPKRVTFRALADFICSRFFITYSAVLQNLGEHMSLKSVLKAAGVYGPALSYLRKTAIYYYKKRIEQDKKLKTTINELNRAKTLETHYGWKKDKEEFILFHLSIQLAEIINTLKERLQLADPNYQNASFLDAGDPDRLVLRSIGSEKGVSLNILDSCVKQILSAGGRPVKGDVQMTPFQDKSFDYALCFETLEHLENPILGLKELARVCNKKIFISIPWVEKTRIHEVNYMLNCPEVEQHVFEFSPADFAKVVTHAGLKITYYKEITIFPKIHNPFHNFLLKKFYYPSFFPKLQFYELTKDEINV